MPRIIKEIAVVKGKKPWYTLLFPFACFCIALAILWNGYETLTLRKDVSVTEVVLGWSFAALVFVILGTVFGMVRDYHFDFNRKRYKIVKRVGILGFGRWRQFQSLEYVSVFENPDHSFEINLWYDANKHFFIDSFTASDTAIKRGAQLSKQLAIEFHNGITNEHYSVENNLTKPIPAKNRKVDAYFSQGNRPFWHTLIAGLCFTLSLAILYIMFVEIDMQNERIRSLANNIEILGLLIATGISFSVVNDYLFDLDNHQFKVIRTIGPIKWGKWRPLSSLDYISVYQKKEGQFQINLWYNKNKHTNISGSDTYDNAMRIGEKLAIKLQIDLLDASDPHNSVWVELP